MNLQTDKDQPVVAHSFSKSLAERCITNEWLSTLMDTSDEWITQRSGIKTRYWVNPGTTTSELGFRAALASLNLAGRPSIDCIIAATLSPDHYFPGIGVIIQHKLAQELGTAEATIPAYDIRNQCSGFLYALQMAKALVLTEQYNRILVVGAEVHSTGLDLSTRGRDIAVLFGDGAGACIVERQSSVTPQNQLIILGSELHSDGKYMEELWCQNPGSANYPTWISAEMISEGLIFPKMNGKKVFEHAVRSMVRVSLSLLAKHDLQPEQISLLVPHQANLRINSLVAKELGLSEEQAWNTVQKYGNTTAATIPIGMTDAFAAGKISSGNYILSAAFGSGFTWGATLFQAV